VTCILTIMTLFGVLFISYAYSYRCRFTVPIIWIASIAKYRFIIKLIIRGNPAGYDSFVDLPIRLSEGGFWGHRTRSAEIWCEEIYTCCDSYLTLPLDSSFQPFHTFRWVRDHFDHFLLTCTKCRLVIQ